MEREEMIGFARLIAERLSGSKGPAYVLIPTGGWSEADREGMELFDPDVNAVFTAELRRCIRDDIPVEEIAVHISDPLFAERSVEILEGMIKKAGTDRRGTV